MLMRHIVICGVSGCSIFFYIISETTRFWKTLLNVKCMILFSLQLLSDTFLISRRMERDTIANVNASSCTVTVIIVRFDWNLHFLDRFFKKILKDKISRKSVQWESSCSIRTDGQTYMVKLIVAFRIFANWSKNIQHDVGQHRSLELASQQNVQQ